MIQDKIDAIKLKIETIADKIDNSKSFTELKMALLGKNGEISALMKNMRDVPPEQRPEVGKIINSLRDWANARLDEIEAGVKKKELSELYKAEKIDVTLPGVRHERGSFHPNTLIRQQLIDILTYFRAWDLKSLKVLK